MSNYEIWSIILNAVLVLIGIVTIVVVILIYKRQAKESLRLKYLPNFEPGKFGEYINSGIRFPISFTDNNAYRVSISSATVSNDYILDDFKDTVLLKDKVYYLKAKFISEVDKHKIRYNFKITYSDNKKNSYRSYFTYIGIQLKSYYPDYPDYKRYQFYQFTEVTENTLQD